ncbi:MAG: hypothetical protein GY851_31070 [bacterium]|nr:hypothetical protein [bacterium]
MGTKHTNDDRWTLKIFSPLLGCSLIAGLALTEIYVLYHLFNDVVLEALASCGQLV